MATASAFAVPGLAPTHVRATAAGAAAKRSGSRIASSVHIARRIATVRCQGVKPDSVDDSMDDSNTFQGRKGTTRDYSLDDDEIRMATQAEAASKLDGSFGKPATSKEVWVPFQAAARAALLASYVDSADSGAAADLVLNSLFIAQEDDAFASRTSVVLPVTAYVKRVDKLVTEFMQRDYPKLQEAGTVSTADVITALEEYLYEQNSYRTPKGWREMYSPYRTYFHNVVAQKVGIPATLAALYIGCVNRLDARGVLPDGVEVLIQRNTSGGGSAGVSGPAAPWGIVAGSKRPSNAVVCTPIMAITLQLSALKRSYWPWEWDEARDSGVLPAVEAAAYSGDNRMNTAAGVVGIIQPSGRAFGDLPMATLATERLLQLAGGIGTEQRDLGVLEFHNGNFKEALAHLEAFQQWTDAGHAGSAPQLVGDGGDPGVGVGSTMVTAALQAREDLALSKLLLLLRKRSLEESLDQK